MITDYGAWAGAFVIGAALGALYFMILWLSVRVLTQRTWVFPFTLVAFYLQALIRIGVVLGSLFVAIRLGASAGEIVLAMIGFVVARFMVTTFIGRHDQEGV